jgi:hypothetical protein
VKYTWLPGSIPPRREEGSIGSSEFHPTCGTRAPVEAGRFVAAFEEPLHAQTDPEKRAVVLDEPQEAVAPLGAERCGRAKMADARHDDGGGRVDLARIRDAAHAAADGDERLLDGLQVADAVIY